MNRFRVWWRSLWAPAAPRPQYVVQLHRMVWGPDGSTPQVQFSWQPVVIEGLADAAAFADRLRRDNRWGDSTGWPNVSLKPVDR